MHARDKITRSAYAIFYDTFFQGTVPAWWDEGGFPVTYATEREAQCEIAEMIMEQLRQFLAGEREFDEVMFSEDYVAPVEVWPDGTIQTEDGRRFGARV
jgi:hypothetical protein